MQEIHVPTQIEVKEADKKNVSQIIITPCHQGYGTTLGNSLRRVLLSSISGAAVEAVKIDGVQHEFSGIDGVMEDMIQIILNLKDLAVISHSNDPVRLSLTKKGAGDVTAGDFDKNADIEIVNPDLKIATVTDKGKEFSMEVIIGKGLGYVPATEKDSSNLELGTILTDSFYSPVKDVGYSIENTRVGDITDYEKLTLTVETNGTITPEDSLNQSTQILMDHYNQVLSQLGGSAAPVVEQADVEQETSEEEEVSEEDEEKTEE